MRLAALPALLALALLVLAWAASCWTASSLSKMPNSA